MKEKIKKLELEAGMIMIYNSNIIPNNYNKVKELREWINPNKEIKFKLLFNKSRDGSYGNDFHKYYDKKGPILALIHTNKGKIFGGYIPINWETPNSENLDKTDDLTFIIFLND